MSFWGTRPSPFTSSEVAILQAIADHSFTDGQLIIGKTSTGGVGFATITAGSGITVTNASGTITLAASGGAASMVVGSSTITSGTDKRILYDNAGVLGEYTISGSGTVVAMATSPSFTTPALGVATATSLAIGGATIGTNGLAVTGHLLLEGVTSTGATGTGNLVFDGTPTLVTPVLGVATATSINKVAFTPPASSATLTIADGKTLTVNQTMTLTSSGTSSVITFPNATDTVAGLGTSQTFTGVNIFTPGARASGVAAYFTITTPADTGQTAANESIGIKTVTGTRTWATTGTVALQREIFLAGPTYASASASQTFTDAQTLYITPPVAGSNAIFTRGHSLTIVDATSAASSITGGFVISTTLGTTATSVGIGGGNINAGGTLIVGGHVTLEGVTSTGATGTNLLVFATSPTLTTPTLGAATATSINGNTFTAGTYTLTGTAGKTLNFTNTLTLSGTDSTTMTFPASSATVAGLGISQTFTGIQTFSPTARSSGSASYFVINAPADTGLATTVESIGINHVGATRTWVDGTTATQREYLFQAPTYNKTTTSAVFTKAATLAVSAAPTAGTGVTITNAYAFWVQAGIAQLDGTLVVAGHVTVEGVTSTGATGTGKFVFDTAPQLSTIELGAASDTTISRVSAGVIAVEGATVGMLSTAQTWTAQNKFNNIVDVNNAIAASSNAATVPVTFRLNTVTNNSAATLTITMTTTSAVDGQMTVVRILDSSAAAQTITWVNTEDSTVAAPTTSNGSTSLFLTVGFIYNSGTSKWRCIAKA